MAELPPLPEIFGNYTIRGISEVLPPEAISWFPNASGWRYVALVLLLLLAWRGWLLWQHWRRNRYRRAARARLQQLVNRYRNSAALLQPLAALLKATALQAYPRTEVAQLSGDNWLRWLDQHGNSATFSPSSAALLGKSVYQAHSNADSHQIQRLLLEAGRWIENHPGAEGA